MNHEEPPGKPVLDVPDPGWLVVFAVLFEGGLAPLSLVFGWLLGQSPLASFALSARDAAIGIVATVPMLALLAVVMRWPIGPFARIKRFFDDDVCPLLHTRPWSDFALVSLAAGVGEEMLFRGAIQGALARSLGPGPALIAASLIFGALHPITRTYAVMAALLGAYLGALWMLTGNLLTAIVAHGLYDFVALTVLVLRSARREI